MNIRARVSRPERRVDAVRVRARRALLFVVLTGIAPVQAQKIGSFSAGTSTDAMTGKTTVYIETESTSEPETETEYRPRLRVGTACLLIRTGRRAAFLVIRIGRETLRAALLSCFGS